MNLQFNLGNNLSQQQQLNLAPQLLQWLRLLQVPSQELEGMVRQELDSNPALEEVDEYDADELAGKEDLADASELPEGNDDGMTDQMEMLAELGREWDQDDVHSSPGEQMASQDRADYRLSRIEGSLSMREQLLAQVAVMGLSAEIKDAAECIIGTLNERGYLDLSLQELAAESGFDESCFDEALKWVQACEPLGIGARTLEECLLLQLSSDEEKDVLPRLIVENGLEAVAMGRIASLAEHLGEAVCDVEDAVARIRTLNPYPGRVMTEAAPVVTVSPDVIIRHEKETDTFEIEVVERYAPRLRISRACRLLIEKGSSLSRTELSYVRSRIRAAMFLIEGLNKRKETLYRIAQEIVRVQHRFLRAEEGEVRPLTMAKVAGIIGVHDTTVSRALADKYIECPGGVFPMKHFFKTGYQCDDGTALTPDMVRQRIEQIIRDEDEAHPVKDEVIAQQLQQDGVPVARRTVAKYRGELGIPSSKERRLLVSA
jgi:RNA polymerase sigma-54 factor